MEIYETHEQMEASQSTVDNSPLSRDTRPDATLDIEVGTYLDGSDEEVKEAKKPA